MSSINRSSSRLRRRSQSQDDPPSISAASNPSAEEDEDESVVEEKEREIKRRESDDSNCPMSQAQMIFHARRSNKNFSVSGTCSLCGQRNAEHPMENSNDSQTLLNALYNPILRIPKSSLASSESKAASSDSSSSSNKHNSSNEYQMSRMIRDLSEHHLIKESWNPNNNMLPQIFLRKYETFMSQLAADMPNIWIKLLPSTLHKSIKSEFEWVNREICQKADITWEAAKKLFIDHWQRSDAGLMLLEQYQHLKQPNFQRVNEFINEFHEQMDINGIDENSQVCNEFLMKLNPWIKRQVLLQLKVRDQLARSMGMQLLPVTLSVIEEIARTIDASSTRQLLAPKDDAENQVGHKRKGPATKHSQESEKNKVPKFNGDIILHCVNHPNLHNHSTEECRLNKNKNKPADGKATKATAPPVTASVLSKSVYSSQSQSNSNSKPAPTPNDESWVCVVCKQKKPGHLPRDCPQKNK
jgi:hypothetical protein